MSDLSRALQMERSKEALMAVRKKVVDALLKEKSDYKAKALARVTPEQIQKLVLELVGHSQQVFLKHLSLLQLVGAVLETLQNR